MQYIEPSEVVENNYRRPNNYNNDYKRYNKNHYKKRSKLVTAIVIIIILGVLGFLGFLAWNFFANRHDYELNFNSHTIASATVNEDFFYRISPASFNASSDGQSLVYSISNGTLPYGLTLNSDTTGPFISGRINPTANINMGTNLFTILASVYGSNAYTMADFSINILQGIWGTPQYDFDILFEEAPIMMDGLIARLAVLDELHSNHFNFRPLETRIGSGNWIAFDNTKNLTRNNNYNIAVRYKATPQMQAGDYISVSVSTVASNHESDFFVLDGTGTLTGFSDFFIAYFSGKGITIPTSVGGISVTGVSWNVLSGFIENTFAPRFNPIIVPSSINRVVGTMGRYGISHRQVIIFEGTTPPTFSNPLPNPTPSGFIRGGRFVVPNSAIASYRTAIPEFGQAVDNLPPRNVFPHQSIVDNYYLIVDNVLLDGFPVRALVSYFGSNSIAEVPFGVSVILPNAFFYANNVEAIVLPHSLNAIKDNAFTISSLTGGLQMIFLINTPLAWEGMSVGNLPFATVLFFSQERTANYQWRFNEDGFPTAWG